MAETNHTRKDPWGIAPTEKWREKANLRHFENRREEGPGDKVEEKAVGRWDEGSLGVGSREGPGGEFDMKMTGLLVVPFRG